MNSEQIERTLHSWSMEAFFSKAQNYASIMHEKNFTDWQCSFWSSLTLEILLRATLSSVSISLIADSKDFNNLLDLLRKYPEDLQFPNEIRKPHPKKQQGIQTAHRCNARPFS